MARNDKTSNGLVAKALNRKVDGVLSADLLPGEIFHLLSFLPLCTLFLLCNF